MYEVFDKQEEKIVAVYSSKALAIRKCVKLDSPDQSAPPRYIVQPFMSRVTFSDAKTSQITGLN